MLSNIEKRGRELIRASNSVGGYRVYPGSPADVEAAEFEQAVRGHFNQEMDRLN